MILTKEQVVQIATSPVSAEIKLMRDESVRLKRNYYGENLTEYLEKINRYENADQHTLRKKFAETNRALTEDLLRPLDNIFSAKGGSRKYTFSTDEPAISFQEKLSNVRDGQSIQAFMAGVFTEHLMTNPGGLVWVEKDPNDQDMARLSIKGTGMIKNYLVSGTEPKYVCFEPHLIEEKAQWVWVVDEKYYYLVKMVPGKTKKEQVETGDVGKKKDQVIENPWTGTIESMTAHLMATVPGIVISPIADSRKNTKISPIEKQMELMDLYSVDNSVKQIYQFLHGYPIFWAYVTACPVCMGTKLVDGKVCPSCGGTGKSTSKDVSDVLWLKTADSDTGQTAPDEVAGYVQPDLETWREMRAELNDKRNKIHYSLWGTTVERKDNETATGRFIDTQPVNNKLTSFAEIFETAEQKITVLLGKFYYPNSFKSASVTYGRRFMIETPDQVWKKYLDAKNGKAPIHILDLLLEQFYESEYKGNQTMLAYMLKLMRIEPFVHFTTDEVRTMSVDKKIQTRKIYFGEWIKTVSFDDIINLSEEQLINLSDTYTLNFITNESKEVPGL